eukprot:11505868-Alexandrium_andersonii.AAC.1
MHKQVPMAKVGADEVNARYEASKANGVVRGKSATRNSLLGRLTRDGREHKGQEVTGVALASAGADPASASVYAGD